MIQRARRIVAVAVTVALAVTSLARTAEIVEGRAKESEARMRRDITLLASDEFEGRGVTTRGINKAADYIAEQFQKAGLKPGGKDGSYFQPFTMAGGTLSAPAVLRLTGPHGQVIDLRQGVQFQP